MKKTDIVIASYDGHNATIADALRAFARGDEFAVLEPMTPSMRGKLITKDDLMAGAAFRRKVSRVIVKYDCGQGAFILDI